MKLHHQCIDQLLVENVFFYYCRGYNKSCNLQEIPGLTDGNVPRRLGPKRASKIRKLFNLTKEDDVRRYVVKRLLPAKEGKENAKPRYKVMPNLQPNCAPEILKQIAIGFCKL